MKNNRALSFIIVAIIYIISAVVGCITYYNLTFDYWLNLLIADTVATVVVFIFSLILKNASCYDPYWSVAPIFFVAIMLISYEINVPRILGSIAVILWGIRLTANWAYTFKNLNHEDWRYRMLHDKTGIFYPIINFVGIHMVPTLIVYGCMLPLVFAFHNEVKFNIWTIIFFICAVCSFTMQGIADVQMHKFRKNPNGTFIRNGLWKYSRHPNYLGEISMWWSIGLLSVMSLGGHYYLLIGAFLNTLLFLFVSIPMADNNQKNRKEGFDEYKKQTRMLLPIYKKAR